MEIKNNLEIVWHIKDNELKREKKRVSKYGYGNVEWAFIKSDMKNDSVDCLVKDLNNEYWKLGLYYMQQEVIEKLRELDGESAISFIKRRNLFEIFYEKIREKQYFNKCELEFISRNAPELYKDALKCRNDFLEKNRLIKEAEEKEKADKVADINNKFRERLKEIKTAIYNKQEIEVEEFIYYKDDDYYKGKTYRNCFLYLVDEYKLDFPLHIKSFINNKLVRFDFDTQKYWYRCRKTQTTIDLRTYMNYIYEKVKEEYEKNKIKEKKKDMCR